MESGCCARRTEDAAQRRAAARSALVIGQDPVQIELARLLLEAVGVQAVVAASVRGAAAGTTRLEPDAVVAVNLRNYDDELRVLLSRVEAGVRGDRPPLIILTGLSLPDSEVVKLVPSFIPGYDQLLEKPCTLEALSRALERAAARGLARRA